MIPFFSHAPARSQFCFAGCCALLPWEVCLPSPCSEPRGRACRNEPEVLNCTLIKAAGREGMSPNPTALAPRDADVLASAAKSRIKTLGLCIPVLYIPANYWVNLFLVPQSAITLWISSSGSRPNSSTSPRASLGGPLRRLCTFRQMGETLCAAIKALHGPKGNLVIRKGL